MQIQTFNLTKRYGRVTALCDCTLRVSAHEIFGLLGPNGAGKSTLLRLLLGLLRPTAGTARIGQWDCTRQSLCVRHQVAYLPGDVRLYRRMRGRQMLRFFAQLRPEGNLHRACQIADRLQLDTSRRIASMSTGMRQKLAIASVLSCDVPLVILDEPTANLDPTMRSIVMDMVSEARGEGRTILFSSHVLPEVEHVCDRVCILRDGQLVHTQTMSELRQRHRIYAQLTQPLASPPPNQNQLAIKTDESGQLTIETSAPLQPLLGWLASQPLDAVRIEPLGLRAIYEHYHALPHHTKGPTSA